MAGLKGFTTKEIRKELKKRAKEVNEIIAFRGNRKVWTKFCGKVKIKDETVWDALEILLNGYK